MAMVAVTPFLVTQAVAQGNVDDRPAAELSDEELTARFRAAQKAARDPATDKALRARLRDQVRADRAELQRRRAEAASDGKAAPGAKERREKRKAAPEPEEQPAEQRAAPEPKEQPAEQQAAPEPKERTKRRAAPEPAEQPTQQQATPEPGEQPARRTGDRPRRQTETEQQAQPQQQQAPERAARRSGDGDRRAQEILRDRRESKQLKDDPLRQRLGVIREILGGGSLSDQYERALLQLLEGDRQELRQRVRRGRDDDRQRADRGRYGDEDGDRGDRRDLRQLLRDDRPSSQLSDAALTARSEAARDALGDKRLRPNQAAQLRQMLQSDRRELRSRLRAGREERRRDLRGRSGGLRIEIRPDIRPAPRRSIAAAEVETQELERQLIAPPTRSIQRQYSFEEYARRPELREVMPGIELDTIHFGFNEFSVREEEIDELERIGEIIERILATNSDEVFVVEGHTDAVGSDAYNLDLSRKRARAVRDALLEYFVIEPGSIETIGYGERYLKIPTELDEAENRRVTVRRITPILQSRR
jgi:outer membrane protein OmpA-like peptidoglycan-associated protein